MTRIRIGARRSPLSQIQTDLVIRQLLACDPSLEIEKVYLTTRGDREKNKSLAAIGGKGLFVGEFEDALRQKVIDLAVHSAKDLPAISDPEFIFFTPERGAVNDLLLVRDDVNDIEIIGTSSPRRENMLKRVHPDWQIRLLRGNINTRIRKLKDGLYDAIVLAQAGVDRLQPDLHGLHVISLDPDTFIPASCQGILAVEALDHTPYKHLLECLDDKCTHLSFDIERRMMSLMNADCHDAIAAYSYVSDHKRYVSAFYHQSDIMKTAVHDDHDLEKLAKELMNNG